VRVGVGMRGKRRRGIAAWPAWTAVLALLACVSDREFDSPYLPGNPDYAGDDWTRDSDHDGIADSVHKYQPDCKLTPKRCLDNAKILSTIPANEYALTARDMLLWLGDAGQAPDLDWTPALASLRGYVLTSSDSSIVGMRDGKLLPMAAGSAQIEVGVTGMPSLGCSFIATVAAQGRRVDSVRVPDLVVPAGKDTFPAVTWFPSDAAFRIFSLSTDQPAVAAIAGQSVRGVAAGTARVTLMTQDGKHQAVFSVKVIEPVRARSLSAEPMFLVLGEVAQKPTLTWDPAGAADQRYRLVTADSGKAVLVSPDSQKVTPWTVGTANVVALSSDGKLSAEFKVTVSATAVPVTGLLAEDVILALGGEKQKPRLAWLPETATDRRYTLSTSDSAIAFPAAGLIEPHGMGVADFLATSVDGGYTAKFKVTVGLPDTTVHVDSVQVEPFSVAVGKLRAVYPSWYPSNAGNQSFSLSTPDTQLVGIRDGSVIGRNPGTANVRLATSDGGRLADFKVNVFAPIIPVEQVTVEPVTVSVRGGAGLAITWSPSDATDLSYTLVSQDTNIVAITNISGMQRVRGISVGAATVILRTSSDQTASFTVTVVPAPIRVNSISVPNMTLGLGDTAVSPVITFNPANATEKGYSLSAAAGGVITVANNKVSAVKTGKGLLTVTPQDDYAALAICTVTVVSRVRSVSAKDDTLRLGAGDKSVIGNLTWNPPDASDKSFSLKSIDTAIVRIAAGGTAYRGLAGGATKVIVRALDGSGMADTFNVLVQVPVSQVIAKDVTLKTTTDTLYNPNSLFTWLPSNASDKSWSLTYANPNAAPAPSTVVGIVSGWQLAAKGPGTTRITVASRDNPAAKDTFTVTVIRPVSGFTVTTANLAMKVGDPDAAAPLTVTPSDASDKAYSLVSGNTGVATAMPGNKVHAVAGGTAIFTASSNSDPSKTASFTVTVTVPVISLKAEDVPDLRIGDAEFAPVLTWNPANATNKGFTLTSLNPSLFTINTATNKLHAVATGVGKAIVSSTDGAKTDTFSVTVVQPVQSLTVASPLNVKRGEDRDPSITWTPANATNKSYTLTGGNATIASVLNNRVHGLGAGSVVMTVTSVDGSKSQAFTVTVTNPVTGIDAGPDLTFRILDRDQPVNPVISPADATDKGWHMVSQDPDIASISASGTSINPGMRGQTEVIVISDDNPAVTDTIAVTVR
jgi:uncharacterized protein YjdB